MRDGIDYDAFAYGWLLAVKEVLDHANGDSIVTMMPVDWARCCGAVLRLKTPVDEDDYRDRFLVASRLGAMVPAGVRCPHCYHTAQPEYDGVARCPFCGEDLGDATPIEDITDEEAAALAPARDPLAAITTAAVFADLGINREVA
jgi:hypothetical protein